MATTEEYSSRGNSSSCAIIYFFVLSFNDVLHNDDKSVHISVNGVMVFCLF